MPIRIPSRPVRPELSSVRPELSSVRPEPVEGWVASTGSARTGWVCLLAFALTACAVGPNYTQPPAVETPTAFKQGDGVWVPATPAQAMPRGDWWTPFDDPVLNDLVARVEVSNQNVAAAAAAYAQARALVASQRAGLFPVVSLDTGANRSGGRGEARESNSFQVNIGASWEPDLWGRLGRSVESARAGEQIGQADLAAARLAAQGELAVNYFNLRQQDAQLALLAQTISGYQRTLQITTNRYNAGVVARTDALQAETQLANAQAEQLALQRNRAQLEHAIAVLVGQAPASFALAAQPTRPATVPAVPLEVPSTVLQRRPDIASAERRVAQANAQIGIAQSAWYPSLRLSASGGVGAASVGDLFNVSSVVWALGASAAQSIFNAGATRAQVQGARAGFDLAAANYRQTVLAAFKGVEDQLVASRVLGLQLPLRQQASRAADLVEQQVLNRYQAGQVNYTEVINAQVTAQNARGNLLQLQADRQVAAVALIQALGGGWNGF